MIDATGKLVIPGGIDPHVHTHWPIPALGGGHTTSAPPEQVSRAALCGGTTTLVDFAVWEPGMTIARAIDDKEAVWRQGYTDYGLHVMLQGAVPPDVIDQIPEAIQAGFPSLKIFTTDVRPIGKGRMIRFGHLWAIMETAARHGGVLAIHAEDDDLVMYMYERLEREGRTDIQHMPLVHSAMSEDIAFHRVLRLARHVEGSAVYFVHVSAAAGVEAIAEARAEGRAIYGETLHHYATFTAEAYLRPDGVLYHTYPSLKHEEDRQRLWSGLKSGTLSTVATDELCTPRAVKVRSRHVADATGATSAWRRACPSSTPRGCPSAGCRSSASWRSPRPTRRSSSASIPRKGVLAPGSDADIVVFDPTVRRALRSADLHGSDYSAWEGWEVHGWPALVILRGKVVVENGKLSGQAGDGRRVPGKLAAAIQDGPAV